MTLIRPLTHPLSLDLTFDVRGWPVRRLTHKKAVRLRKQRNWQRRYGERLLRRRLAEGRKFKAVEARWLSYTYSLPAVVESTAG